MRPAELEDEISCQPDDLALKFYPVLSSLQLFRVAVFAAVRRDSVRR